MLSNIEKIDSSLCILVSCRSQVKMWPDEVIHLCASLCDAWSAISSSVLPIWASLVCVLASQRMRNQAHAVGWLHHACWQEIVAICNQRFQSILDAHSELVGHLQSSGNTAASKEQPPADNASAVPQPPGRERIEGSDC